MLGIQMIFLMALVAPPDLIRDYEVSYINNAQGEAEVSISWTLQKPATKLIMFRGQTLLEELPGDATSYSITETCFGEIQYSVAWMIGTWCMQLETEILSLGKFSWTPSQGTVTCEEGYKLYIADDPAEFAEPETIEDFLVIEGGETLEITLREVMDAGLITPNLHQYAAMASYATLDGVYYQSALTDPIDVEFQYFTYVISWAPPQAPTNIQVGN